MSQVKPSSATPGQLTSQNVIVTGASGGIGQAICLAMAEAGACVAAHYSQNQQTAMELVEKINHQGGKALAVQADLAQPNAAEQLFNQAEAQLGQINILVNNAGVGCTAKFTDLELSILDHTLNINLRAVILLLQQAGKRLANQGAIINISSMLGQHAMPGKGVYSATKAAVDILTRTAALEFGERGISVTSLSPGATSPGMFDNSSEERKAAFAQATPLKRIGNAHDIAAMAVFLASQPGRWINGTTLLADGGYSS